MRLPGLALVLAAALVGPLGSALATSPPPDAAIVIASRDPIVDRFARAAGAHRLDPALGIWLAAPDAAPSFARALARRGLLIAVEPDVPARPAAAPDPLDDTNLGQALPVPEQRPQVPARAPLAIVDSGADPTHPDVGPVVRGLRRADPTGHGTAAVSVAAAPRNGVGFAGVWPGLPTRVYAIDLRSGRASCATAARAVIAAARRRTRVISMSYGFGPGQCRAHLIATQFATARGALPVASAGNDGLVREPLGRPAADPHVLTVGAILPDGRVAPFSTPGPAVDLAAPGVGLVVAVPHALDRDGTPDGYTRAGGTSVSTPAVAALATWLRAARPRADAGQAAELLRASAKDLGRRGRDAGTGMGMPQLAVALQSPMPARDPGEPNDDAEWVNGTHLPPAPLLVPRGAASTVRASVHRAEDPVDVYAVSVPRGRTLHAGLTPERTDVDLEIYAGDARTVLTDRGRLAGSDLAGRRTDVAVATNPGRTGRLYVVVYPPGRRMPTAPTRYALRLRLLPAAAAVTAFARG